MRYSTIVASLESPELVELTEAIRLVEPGGSIHALVTLSGPSRGGAETEVPEALEALRERAAGRPREAVLWAHARRGDRGTETLRLAVESRADLVIVGAFEPGSEAVVSQITRSPACSVLVLTQSRPRELAQGFVPEFEICQACDALRGPGSERWFCQLHDAPSERAFARLDDRR